MKQKIKNELLVHAAIDVIRKGVVVTLLLLAGASAGYALANKEREPCPVGFASVDDMIFLISQLKECEGFSRHDL